MAKQYAPIPPEHPHAVYSPPAVGTASKPKLARAQLGPSNFQVNYDPSLGNAGLAIAQGVLQTAEGDLAKLVTLFGSPPKQGPFVINLAQVGPDGQPIGGAFHSADGGLEIWVNPLNPESNQLDADYARMLVVAEVVEDFEFWQGQGWNLVHTNGEGLSRLLASALYPSVIPASRAAVADAYLQAGMPDCINDNSRPDTDNVGNGGAVLFLNWLTTQLGYDYDQVVQAPADTLAGTYTILQGRDDAYQRFVSDLGHLPQGSLTTDNPFPVFPAAMNIQTRVSVARMTGAWS
jgi:hypothetical protein